MRKHLTLLFLLLPIFGFGQIIDRDVIGTAGETFEEGSILLDWTLGEVTTESLNVGSILLTQGFHQGNLEVNALPGQETVFELKVYPNPVTDILIIEAPIQDLDYRLVDANGRVISNGNITSDPYELDFTNQPPGIYFLWVDEHQTHKIIKH